MTNYATHFTIFHFIRFTHLLSHFCLLLKPPFISRFLPGLLEEKSFTYFQAPFFSTLAKIFVARDESEKKKVLFFLFCTNTAARRYMGHDDSRRNAKQSDSMHAYQCDGDEL